MLVCLSEPRPFLTSLPVAGRWGGAAAHVTMTLSLSLYLHVSLSFPLYLVSLSHSFSSLAIFFLSLSALSSLLFLSLPLCLSVSSLLCLKSSQISQQHMERESEWLTETKGKEERGNTLHDQSGVTRGWVLQGGWWWGLRNIWQIFL